MKLLPLKKNNVIKILLILESAIIVSLLHTLLLNVFFLNRYSFNILLYVRAIIRILPHFSRLSTASYLVLSTSFLFEVIVWVVAGQGIIKIIKKAKDDIPLYGTAEWATNGLLKGFGYIVKKNRSAVVCGQSDDAVFIQRLPNKSEKKKIKAKYEKEIQNNPQLNESEREEVYNRLNDELKTVSAHEKTAGSYLVGTAEFNNTLTIGGVGSCKSQGTIIPTLLTWRESVVVNDPKGELFEATAGYRSTFSDVYYINPLDLCSTFRLNFLDWIPRDERAIASLQRFVKIAIPDNVGDSQPYFNTAGREVFLILLLHAIVYGEHQSVGEALAHLASDNSSSIKDYFNNMFAETQNPKIQINPGCESLLKDLKNNIGTLLKEPESTFANVVSTMRSKLQIFTDPKVISLSNDTTINADQFQKTKRPISIYITTPTSDVDRCKDYIRLVFSSILIQLTSEQLKKEQMKNRVLFVLDEFFQLGTMDEVYKKIPIARGYGIQFMIAVQSIAQIYANYGQKEAQSIFENMTIKDIKQVGEPETASWVKSLLGRETIVKKRKSESRSHSNGSSNTSVSTQKEEVGHDLMDENQIMNMAYEEQLTIVKKVGKPYKSKKIHAFEDERFKDKMNLPFELNSTPCELFTVVKTFGDKNEETSNNVEEQKNEPQKETKTKKSKQKTKEETDGKTLFDLVNDEINNTSVIDNIAKATTEQKTTNFEIFAKPQNSRFPENAKLRFSNESATASHDDPQNHKIGDFDKPKTTKFVISENTENETLDNVDIDDFEPLTDDEILQNYLKNKELLEKKSSEGKK